MSSVQGASSLGPSAVSTGMLATESAPAKLRPEAATVLNEATQEVHVRQGWSTRFAPRPG